MGNSKSYPGLTEDVLEDYISLTYLNKGEILHLMKKFYSIDPQKLDNNYNHRFGKKEILNKFNVLKCNPFQDRLFSVFSSEKDDCFSFEDLLDLCSVMCSECPPDVKAVWAFKVYDLDEDNQISYKDIMGILDRLTWESSHHSDCLDDESKRKIVNAILEDMKLDITGSIGLNEFKIMMSRIPEFQSSFYFRL